MSGEHGEVPRLPLLGAAALVGFALLTVATARLSGERQTARIEAVPVMQARLQFRDREDGAVVVREAGTDRVVGLVEPGSGGFVRATLRALSRERKRNHLGNESPFVLQRYGDGRVVLIDTATQRRVDLAAFGPTNSGAFAALLPEQP